MTYIAKKELKTRLVKMKPQIEHFENYSLMKLSGQFVGGEESDKLFDLIHAQLNKEKPKLILDFEKVTYFSSIVIGLLIKANREYLSNHGQIIICNLSKTLKEIFNITKVSSFMTICNSIEESVQSLN